VFAAAVLILLVSVAIAIVGVSTGPLSCPVDTVAVRNRGFVSCERFVNPAAGPSHVELVEATRDRKLVERFLIVGVGALGAVFLTALALRLSTARASDESVP
jgi:hypothetical protein